MADTKPDAGAAGEAVPPTSSEALWSTGRDTIEYDEYPDFKENMISEAFIKRMVGHFNNDDPDTAFEGWNVIAQSKPKPKDNIKYTMGKKQVEGMPTIEIMGYAEFEGVSAAACWETMENHRVRMDWDGNMDEFHTVEKLKVIKEGRIWHEVCYSKTKFPFPLSPRDCVYNKYINLNPEKGLYFCVWRPCSHPAAAKRRKVTRSWSYGAQLMYQMPGNRMRVWQGGCGNPKGNIPAWLINIAMPKLAVGGIRDLRSKTEEVQRKLAAEGGAQVIPQAALEDAGGGVKLATPSVDEEKPSDGEAAPNP